MKMRIKGLLGSFDFGLGHLFPFIAFIVESNLIAQLLHDV